MLLQNFFDIAWILWVIDCSTCPSSFQLMSGGYKDWFYPVYANYEESLTQIRQIEPEAVRNGLFVEKLDRIITFAKALKLFNEVVATRMAFIHQNYEKLKECAGNSNVSICMFHGYGRNEGIINPETIFGLIFKKDTNIPDALKAINFHQRGILENFANRLSETHMMKNPCLPKISVQNWVTDALIDVALVLRRGHIYLFTMMMWAKHQGSRTWDSKKDYLIDEYSEKSINETFTRRWFYLGFLYHYEAPKYSKRMIDCTPIEGKTEYFTVFKEFLVYDKDLENKINDSDVKVVKKECLVDSKKCTGTKPQCVGAVTNCRRLNTSPKNWITRLFSSESKIKICVDGELEYVWNIQGYNYEETTFGNMSCPEYQLKEFDSYINDAWITWLGENNYLNLCTCTHTKQQGNIVSLHEVVSDVEKNRVVTGVGFSYQDNILELQIKEGKLMPYGGINFTYDQINWYFGVDERYEQPTQWKVAHFETDESKQTRNVNFFSFDHENRSLQLDQYNVGEGWVLTGVRFLKDTYDKKTYFLKLDARFTQFNATTGILNSTTTYWMSEKINAFRARKMMNFNVSSLKKNVGQFTTPSIDFRPLEPKPEVALSGIGLTLDRRNDTKEIFLRLNLESYDRTVYSLLDLARLPEEDKILLKNFYT